MGSGAVLLIADTGGKAAVAVGVTADVTDRVSAVDILRAVTPHLVAKAAVVVLTWRRAVVRPLKTPGRDCGCETVLEITMTALWIAHVTVTDEVAYAEYAKRATVAIAEHGGVFLARGGRMSSWKGQTARAMLWPVSRACRPRTIAIIRMHTKTALGFAKGASQRELCIVEEIDD